MQSTDAIKAPGGEPFERTVGHVWFRFGNSQPEMTEFLAAIQSHLIITGTLSDNKRQRTKIDLLPWRPSSIQTERYITG